MRSPTTDAMPELADAAEPAPLLPPLVLATCLACVAGAATLANCALIAVLLKRSINGLYLIILQLAVADFGLIATAIGPELWWSNMRTWTFGTSACVAHRGLNVFTSTASLYLVNTIALHTLATVNLEMKAAIQRNKKRDCDDDEEIRSSRHSLVASSDTSTPPRTMNVDYRLIDTVVPIAPPSIFVWVLSASLSIPEFALATTVRTTQSTIVCTLVDSNHKERMQALLAMFNFFLPVFIMTTTAILIIFKLKSKKLRSHIEETESTAVLKLSLCLIFVYGGLCAPHSVLNVYSILYSSTIDDVELVHKNNNILLVNLAFNAAYLIATLIRPVVCLISISKFGKQIPLEFRTTDNINI